MVADFDFTSVIVHGVQASRCSLFSRGTPLQDLDGFKVDCLPVFVIPATVTYVGRVILLLAGPSTQAAFR